MNKKIAVLGAGLVGHAIVEDLARDHEYQIDVFDNDLGKLKKFENAENVKTQQVDLLREEDFTSLLKGIDCAISAVPGFMGFETLLKIIKTGTNVVDIAFFPEEPFQLDQFAKEHGVTAVIDCGVAPGLCNIILGYQNAQMDDITRYECYVGGLPKVRTMPFQYKAGFSPIDVLEEYIRPARFIEFGEAVVKPALSDIEHIDVPGVGTLEAFNTDGLRSLLKTINVPFMKEKTLRYPGHAAIMQMLRDNGFLGYKEIEVKGKNIKPIDLTSRLLFKNWQFDKGEEDITFMRVIIDGRKGTSNFTFTYDLLDSYDKKTGTTSMARTTGYTCTAVARLLLSGQFTQRGICPPEYIGQSEKCYRYILDQLSQRNIVLEEKLTKKNA
ncbi:MAG: saccharopine dehydrogenase NADP-binding domain-containing protein [Candidatus Cloacimonetes bacterium]|nr:saccharopine dehydrogenase NADP-binding domain-containing protein [Candidatus Cloacimonadota bacterium]